VLVTETLRSIGSGSENEPKDDFFVTHILIHLSQALIRCRAEDTGKGVWRGNLISTLASADFGSIQYSGQPPLSPRLRSVSCHTHAHLCQVLRRRSTSLLLNQIVFQHQAP
jgi:hypothetical protein